MTPLIRVNGWTNATSRGVQHDQNPAWIVKIVIVAAAIVAAAIHWEVTIGLLWFGFILSWYCLPILGGLLFFPLLILVIATVFRLVFALVDLMVKPAQENNAFDRQPSWPSFDEDGD